jgi:hypothetical protein
MNLIKGIDSIVRVLEEFMVPNRLDCRGLNKLEAKERVEVVMSLEEIIAAATGRLSPLVPDVLPTPLSMERLENGSYRIELLKGDAVAPDPARWASLSGRLQETSKFLGIVKAVVLDLPDIDGHGFFHPRVHPERLFQMTGYILGTDGEEPVLSYRSPVVKGMMVRGLDHPSIPSKYRNLDAVLSKSTVKGAKFPEGTVVSLGLFEQSPAAESKRLIPISLSWQFVTRALELMTRKGLDMVAQSIREFVKLLNLMDFISDEANDFETTLMRVFRLGLIPDMKDLRGLFASRARGHYKVRWSGFIARLMSDIRVKPGHYSAPPQMKGQLQVGDQIVLFRSPFLGTEVRIYRISDFEGRGIRDPRELVGDTDGDIVFGIVDPKGELFDPHKIEDRVKRMSGWVPILEAGQEVGQISGWQASMKLALSKIQVGLRDSQITRHLFTNGGVFDEGWAVLNKHAQDAVDSAKKDIPGIEFITKLEDRGAPWVYKLLNGKFEGTWCNWTASLRKARREYNTFPGLLGRLSNYVLKHIPTPVFREFGTDFNTQFYPKRSMPSWVELIHGAGPAFLKEVEKVVAQYKDGARLIAEGQKDEGIEVLHNLSEWIENHPLGGKISDFIAINILTGNPLKLIGKAKILTWLPGLNQDLIRYYNWLRLRTTPSYESIHFKPDFSYRVVKWNHE